MRAVLGIAVCVATIVSLAEPGVAGATPAVGSILAPGRTLATGATLRSPDGRTTLTITDQGRARLTRAGRTVWSSPSAGAGAVLVDGTDGNLRLMRAGRTVWQTNTRGAGRARLAVGDGVMTLATGAGTVWSTRLGNACGRVHVRHEVIVDLSRQRAWLCARRQQILTTPVTTGASRLGAGTPTGTWQVYAKVRHTTLRPAGGGAYPVRYWMPYDGAYGMHDSRWQKFPYGSSRYKTEGSHGCTHFPAKAMRRLFAWAPRGTTVNIHR